MENFNLDELSETAGGKRTRKPIENREKHGRGAEQALKMLNVFASVGVRFFDITHTNIDGDKRGFRPKQSLTTTRTSMPHLVDSAPRRQNNVIVRPHQPRPVLLVQLDDLSEAALDRVRSVAFLVLKTSPGNHQAWIAVEGGAGYTDADFARRLRKGASADLTASGATRVAGTANFKRKYEPNFPTIEIAYAQPGRKVTAKELETLGLVAAPEPLRPMLRREAGRAGKWPSYQYCLDHATKAHGGEHPDVSRADFTWALTAIDWGFSVEDVASRLMEESPKARENGHRYALLTATNAAAAIQRRAQPAYGP